MWAVIDMGTKLFNHRDNGKDADTFPEMWALRHVHLKSVLATEPLWSVILLDVIPSSPPAARSTPTSGRDAGPAPNMPNVGTRMLLL